jgi:hypothetical protein
MGRFLRPSHTISLMPFQNCGTLLQYSSTTDKKGWVRQLSLQTQTPRVTLRHLCLQTSSTATHESRSPATLPVSPLCPERNRTPRAARKSPPRNQKQYSSTSPARSRAAYAANGTQTLLLSQRPHSTSSHHHPPPSFQHTPHRYRFPAPSKPERSSKPSSSHPRHPAPLSYARTTRSTSNNSGRQFRTSVLGNGRKSRAGS